MADVALVAGLGVLGALLLLLLPLPWPEVWVGSRVVSRILIAAPAPRVFAYVTTPATWPRWHPATRAVRGVTDRTPPVGTSVVETFELGHRRGEVRWTTLELDAPRRWSFAASGHGGKARIVYTLASSEHGTLWERELAYCGPNLLFGILDRLRIRALMQADSTQALANVKRQLEASP